MTSLLRAYPTVLTLGLALLLSVGAVQSQGLPQSSTNNAPSLLGSGNDFLPVTDAFKLEHRFFEGQLVLHWDVAPDYYLYKSRFKFEPQGLNAPQIDPQYSDGSVDKYDEFFEQNMAVYYGGATVNIDLSGQTQAFVLKVESQGCADAGLCYPPHTDYLQVDPSQNAVDAIDAEQAEQLGAKGGADSRPDRALWLPQVLLFALLGGVILNLMPCVFPVLSIKLMSLAQADRARLPLHGWAYTLGIVVAFLAFAALLLLARAGGEAIGWGFQLQSPLLIAALAYLFFILGLSLSGLLQIGTRWMGAGQGLTQKTGLGGSFFTGVLAAVVASPCTAPFMGAALGFALTQPASVSLSVFVVLGFGMALPLLVLCYLPGLVRHLPRPGPWMDSLKEFLAFPLYLTAIWLLWVLGRQAGINAVAALCVGALAIVFGCWLQSRQVSGWRKNFNRTLALLAWVTAIILPWQMLQQAEPDSRWQAYSPERLTQLRAEGRPVFVNLTADWCLTCLANERLTLSTEAVEQAFDRQNVATLKGDWTNSDPQISALLDDYQRSGVPLYLWFPANHKGQGQILPQLLRQEALLQALEPQEEP